MAGQFSVLVAVEAAGPGRGGGIAAVLASEHGHENGGRGRPPRAW